MPSKNMLPKGNRRVSVKKEYREQRTLIQEREAAARAAGEPVAEAIEPFYDTADFIPLHSSPYVNVPGLVTSGPNGGKHPQEEASMSKPRVTPKCEFAGWPGASSRRVSTSTRRILWFGNQLSC